MKYRIDFHDLPWSNQICESFPSSSISLQQPICDHQINHGNHIAQGRRRSCRIKTGYRCRQRRQIRHHVHLARAEGELGFSDSRGSLNWHPFMKKRKAERPAQQRKSRESHEIISEERNHAPKAPAFSKHYYVVRPAVYNCQLLSPLPQVGFQ